MTSYNTGDNNNFDEQSTEESRIFENLKQEIAQLESQLRYKKKIKSLWTGELDREDLDYIPLYSPKEWESYEQYDRIVGDPLSRPDSEEIDEIEEGN